MTYTDLALAPRASVKDIKKAAPRTQLYARLFQRAHGATAQEMKEAVHEAFPEVAHLGFTPHNSYSLQLLANTYGFTFVSIDYTDGSRRYFFRSSKNADKVDAALSEQTKAIEASKRAPRKAKASGRVPMPVVSNPDAKAKKRVAKATRAAQASAGAQA
jgi:hypothetical protein